MSTTSGDNVGQCVRRGAMIFAGILFVVLATRFPYFFKAVISWDESTFILVGQELLDGYLPYVRLWDVKPPLAFAMYAASIELFGQTIAGVRLAGAICVFAVALAIFAAGRHLRGSASALIVSALVVVGLGTIAGGQATLTEHFAAVPLTWALVYLIRKPADARGLILVGLLLSCATLIRTNLAYVSIAVVLALLARPSNRTAVGRFTDVAALGLGAIIPIAVCIVPYWVSGELELLLRSVVVAPMAYATTQLSALEAIAKFISAITSPRRVVVLLILALGLVGIVRMAWRQVASRTLAEPEYWQVVVTVSATLSVILSGAAHAHYLIQILPLYAIAAFAAMPGQIWRGTWQRLVLVSLLVLISAVSLIPVGRAYGELAERVRTGLSLYSGRALDVAEYLKAHNPGGEPVYLATDHIAYWLTGSRPITRISTHPSNVAKAPLIRAIEGDMADSISELERIFQARPLFVIKSPTPWYLEKNPELLHRLNSEINEKYRLVARIQDLEVHQRSDD